MDDVADKSQQQRQLALDVLRTLREAGYESLFAGGCVRDQLLGITPKDYDVATNATPEQVRELFGKRRTIAVGAAFGVIAILGKKGQDPIETATFRSDGAYVDGRRPTGVQYTTAEQDAQRRDFTINGMFLDPLEQDEAKQVVDYVGGLEDLENRTLRAIGDPGQRFAEDKLRLLRAVRFAATYDLKIEENTFAAIKAMAGEVTVVSAERIGMEISRLLKHPNRAKGVSLLAETRLLETLFPEVTTGGNDFTTWRERLDVLSLLQSQTLPPALAALMAELATPQEAKALCRRIRLTNQEGERTAWLLEKLPLVESADQLPWPQLQRILIAEGSDELMELATATWGEDHAGVARCRELLNQPIEVFNPPPLVTGDDLIAHGIAPGKHFKALLDFLRDQQLDGRLETKAAALAAADQWVSKL